MGFLEYFWIFVLLEYGSSVQLIKHSVFWLKSVSFQIRGKTLNGNICLDCLGKKTVDHKIEDSKRIKKNGFLSLCTVER